MQEMMPDLPTGTVTFLFSDIQGSTQLLQKLGDEYSRVLSEHHRLLRDAFAKHHGIVIDTQGDSFFVAFTRALDAVRAAADAQRALHGHDWGSGIRVHVRMGLHTGEPVLVGERYVGMDVHRAARIGSAGHGGQVLVSESTKVLIQGDLPHDMTLYDLGEHRLKDLRTPKHLYQLVISGLPVEYRPLKTMASTPNNLPIQLTSFIGRTREIENIKRRMMTARLITLTGSGGSGKTRLSLQAAGELLEEFRDGVWFIELAPLADPELVPQSIASVLGIREQTGEAVSDVLMHYLHEKELLLILDNCEHLVDMCAKMAEQLLRACPKLRILASSREALGIAGEVPYRVPSLSLPNTGDLSPDTLSQFEAVRLFVDRAVTVQPTFAVNRQNADAVVQVCARLDGIPLALELAAARVQALSVEQIAKKLDDRFGLLTGGSRSALPRHRTLEAAIDWSYELLTDGERLLLRRLAVFSGGWTLDAAEFVCSGDGIESNEILDLLLRLTTKSMVIADQQTSEMRYRLLETIRQYAQIRLEEASENVPCRNHHLEFFLALAEEAEPKLRGREQLGWLERLENEHDNFRAALVWSRRPGTVESGLKLVAALYGFWKLRGYTAEGFQQIELLLPLADHLKDTATYARAVGAAGDYALVQSDLGHARARLEESVRIFHQLDNSIGLADSLQSLFKTLWTIGEHATAQVFLDESLEISRSAGYERGVAEALGLLGFVRMEAGDNDGASQLFEESLALSRKLGDETSLSGLQNTLGEISLRKGDYVKSRMLLEQALAIARELGLKLQIGIILIDLGNLALIQGDYEGATSLLLEALALSNELGYEEGSTGTRNILGRVAVHQADYERARTLFEQNLTWCKQVGHKHGAAWELQSLGHLALHEDNALKAGEYLRESLELFQQFGERMGMADCIEDLAQVASLQGRFMRCVQLMAAAKSLRSDIGAPLPPYLHEEQANTIATARTNMGEELFASVWDQGQTLTLDQGVILALERESSDG